MNSLARFFRLVHISYLLLKHGLDEIILAIPLFRPLRFLLILSPFRWTERYQKPRAIRIREALEELGPIFVKLGQLLSTRSDLIPEDIIKELVRLQDQVAPFCGEIAKNKVTRALGQPLDHIFKQFEVQPLASASIAQVHAATLLDGREVVVKILRPNIGKMIERDVDLMKVVARLVKRYSKTAKQFKPLEIVTEFENALNFELDLLREAANASQLRRNFIHSTLLYVPEIHWQFTKATVLVMERIYGIPIYNIELLRQRGVDLKRLAERGIEVFFTQVFRDCFFHADMHPGNIFVSTENPASPQLIAIDFGIVGTLGANDQRYLAENFLAFLKRDYRRVAELHRESGWIDPTVRLDEFESAIRTVCEPIFERPIKDISMGQLLLRLFQTASKFQINIQPQLILLQKTLLTIEGLGRELYPDLDLWQTARPFLEKWIKTQMGPRALLQKIKAYGPFWLERLPELPNLVYGALFNLAHVEARPVVTPQPLRKASKIDILFGILLGIGFSALFLLGGKYL
jgi:ubiquinone biosynthesis protein